MLQLSVVEDPGAFADLQAAWNRLLASSAANSVTLTWEWLSTWWSVFGDARRLRILLVWDRGRLVGGAPMLTRTRPEPRYKVLPFRRMELVASGEARADQICSDYIGWIAERGREAEVAEIVLEGLYSEYAHEWDELRLPDLPADSPVLGPLADGARRRGLGFEIVRRESCALIRLPASWDAFLENVSSGLRYKIRRGRRELEKVCGRYRVVEDASEIEEAVATLVTLHQQRWTDKGRPGAFRSDRRRQFHERLIPLAFARGWLRLGVLDAGGGPIGAIYNFMYGGRVFFYQSGIVPVDNTHLRPGVLMHAAEVEHAIGAGCTEYDFLKRGHSEYKDAWANQSRDIVSIRVARRGPKETALTGFRFVHETLRGLKRRVEAAGRAAAG